MPTNDERREIAERLRDYAYSDLTDNEIWWGLREIAYGGKYSYQRHASYELLNRLADLIEPEERTCRIDRRVPDAPFCSECAYDWNDDWNFCPNCGAKVASE